MVKYHVSDEKTFIVIGFLFTKAAMVNCWANLADTFYDLGSWFGLGLVI